MQKCILKKKGMRDRKNKMLQIHLFSYLIVKFNVREKYYTT